MTSRKEKLERYKKAEITLGDVLGVTSNQEKALLMVSYNFYSQGKLDQAMSILQGLELLDEKLPEVHALLGSIHQKREEYEDAFQEYSHALSLRSDDLYTLCNRGEILIRLGRLDEAADDLKKAIELDPDMKHPAANRARLLVNLIQSVARTLNPS